MHTAPSALIHLSIQRDASAGQKHCRECLSSWFPGETPRHHHDCNSVEEGHERRPACPDGGTCHGKCDKYNGGYCSRVGSCGPLSGVFPDDEWPAEILAKHTAPSYTVEDATLGDKILHGGEWLEVRGLRMAQERGIELLFAGKGWTKFKEGKEVELQEAP